METYPFPTLKISFDTEYTTKEIKIKLKDDTITLPKGNFCIEHQVESINDHIEIEFYNFSHDDKTQKVVLNILHGIERKDASSVCSFEMKNNLYTENVLKNFYNTIFFNGKLKIVFFKKWFECNILGGAQILDRPNLPVQWILDYKPSSLRVEKNKDKFDIVCLGCSFTYGAGLNAHETWPHILGEQAKLDVANFGTVGAGIDSILKQFFYVEKNITAKQVFVLLPSFYRRRIKFKFGNKICEYLHVLGSRSINFLSKDYLKKVDKEIIAFGKKRGTRLIKFFENKDHVKLTSWDKEVYQNLNSTKRLPKYIFDINEGHPNFEHNESFVKSLHLTCA